MTSMNPRFSIALGNRCVVDHSFSIAIGDGAESRECFELIIKVGDEEFRDKITPAEHDVLYYVLKRMIDRKGQK